MEKKIALEDLKKALEKSWSRETSADPNHWTSENPAWGQCAVTACMVQSYFGGNLLRAFFDIVHNGKTINVSHYWNQLPDGSEIDLTREQFTESTIVPTGKIKERDYVLSYPDTVKRHDILKQEVEKYFREKEMSAKKIFLICPVRYGDHITTEEHRETQKKIRLYVEKLEKAGHKVYWPLRDTNQDDPTGLRICTDNAKGIIWADEIHVWWDPNSQGSLFDFGMSFMCHILGSKKIVLANPGEVKPTEKKSFNNVLLELHKKNFEGRKK